MNGLAGALWCEKQFAEATALRKESLQVQKEIFLRQESRFDQYHVQPST